MNILGLVAQKIEAGLKFVVDEAKKIGSFLEHAAPILLTQAITVFGHDAVVAAASKAIAWTDLNETAVEGKVEGEAISIVRSEFTKLHLMDSGIGAAAANHLSALLSHAIEVGGADVRAFVDKHGAALLAGTAPADANPT